MPTCLSHSQSAYPDWCTALDISGTKIKYVLQPIVPFYIEYFDISAMRFINYCFQIWLDRHLSKATTATITATNVLVTWLANMRIINEVNIHIQSHPRSWPKQYIHQILLKSSENNSSYRPDTKQMRPNTKGNCVWHSIKYKPTMSGQHQQP